MRGTIVDYKDTNGNIYPAVVTTVHELSEGEKQPKVELVVLCTGFSGIGYWAKEVPYLKPDKKRGCWNFSETAICNCKRNEKAEVAMTQSEIIAALEKKVAQVAKTEKSKAAKKETAGETKEQEDGDGEEKPLF